MDHESNTYLAVTLDKDGQYTDSPSSLAALHPTLSHAGQAGALDHVQLLSVARGDWGDHGAVILERLREAPGVLRVDVQALKQREKRDEL